MAPTVLSIDVLVNRHERHILGMASVVGITD